MSVGDQLWIKLIGPPSCGKSTLCEAVSVAHQYVYPKSTIRGFHSGYGDEEEDNSLIAKVRGKTLVTKDGDTLLQSPNLGQILSEARDLYDSVSRTHYRNKKSKDYSGVRMTWILAGTSSLRSIDHSEVGERFLDCVIMDEIEDELEDQILMRVVDKATENVARETTETAESQYDPDLAHAMSLTGGYIAYLRETASNELRKINASRQAKLHCAKLGKLVSFARARPSSVQDEDSQRELGARLASQLTRMAMCLALVLNKRELDDEVLERTTKVALDTSRGVTLTLMGKLYTHQQRFEKGIGKTALLLHSELDEATTTKLIRFLVKIKAIVRTEKKRGEETKYVLTPQLMRLLEAVYE